MSYLFCMHAGMGNNCQLLINIYLDDIEKVITYIMPSIVLHVYILLIQLEPEGRTIYSGLISCDYMQTAVVLVSGISMETLATIASAKCPNRKPL